MLPLLFTTQARRAANGWGAGWPHLLQALLPNLCALCGNLSRATLCPGCAEAYWNESRVRCTLCAIPIAAGRAQYNAGIRTNNPPQACPTRYRCADCIGTPRPFDATLTLGDYRAPLDALALGLKFRARLNLARVFAEQLADAVLNLPGPPQPFDVIAPVPLSARRLAERGYNQAWEIARPLARKLRVPGHATLLRRVVHTAPQARLDLEARRRNVSQAFVVAKPVRNLHVALVDDVMTTGATLEALARTLKSAGARRVTNLVALRTPKN
ncbi:ComF family protein [Paraburkholderia hayleyella]|uniref:ComF family protein n=1 Tax=Paraburkholderia hayleyella TaxID=2152889 RepID=UPI001FE7BD56|nr:ComF family protein [Paraburkholderia hayleyella]